MDVAGSGLNINEAEYWIFVAISGLVTLVALLFTFIYWHRARVIEDTPTSRIRSAHQGYVELEGSGEKLSLQQLLAPITLTPCLWYRYKVEERRSYQTSEGGRASTWSVVQSGISEEMFLLNDDTGKCLVDPEGAAVTPSEVNVWYSDSSHAWEASQRKSMGRWNLLFALGGRFKFTEELIYEGDHLYVIGQFNSISAQADMPSKHDAVRELLREWKQNKEQLLERFDANHDGEIDAHEWEAVREAAEKQIAGEHNEILKMPQYHIVNKPPNARQPFMISHHSQETLAERFKWKALAALIIFLAGIATTVYLLQQDIRYPY
jgi:hypothetical protein